MDKQNLKDKISDLLKDRNLRDEVVDIIVDIIDEKVDIEDVIEDNEFLSTAADMIVNKIDDHDRKLSKRYEAFNVNEERRLAAAKHTKQLSKRS